MVRKSERNRSTTDKVEISTRKLTRSTRRIKASEPEAQPEVSTEEPPVIEAPPTPQPQVVEVEESSEPQEVKSRRGRPRRPPVVEEQPPAQPQPTPPPPVEKEPEEAKIPQAVSNENPSGSTDEPKTGTEQPKIDVDNSTWKVQSSNGAGGELQKLKICRQRLTDSAESSSSPAKEISSPRRKRKIRLDEGDGAESAGSHTDTELPTSSAANDVLPTLAESEEVQQPSTDSAVQQEEVVALLVDKETSDAVAAILVPVEEETYVAAPSPEPIKAASESEETATESVEVKVIKDEVEAPEVKVIEDEVEAPEMKVIKDEVEAPEVNVIGDETAQPEQPAVKAPPPETPEAEEVEEGELKPTKKPVKNLKLAVSNEDALQQIAKKLNERAARFSKEATEEAARRFTPAKPSTKTVAEEEDEEGEIARDPSTTETLQLKRLSDDDIEPTNQRRELSRRPPVSTSAPENVAAKQQDVSTVTLKLLLPDIELVPEEEVESLFNPMDDVHTARDEEDEGEVDAGDAAEDDCELAEDERRKSVEEHSSTDLRQANQILARTPSREEAKKAERRVTKELGKKSLKSDRKERRPSVDEPKAKKKFDRVEFKTERDDDENKSPSKHKSVDRVENPENIKNEENHRTVRKISIVTDDNKSVRRSVSPPAKKSSPVLFITNLVRPFTIGQLRELLARTGTIAPSGFYIDKIKSKCFVKYNDVDMAIETRHALHGVRWPVTNPRTLRVEFSYEEAMETVKKMAEEEDNDARQQDLAAQNFDKSWLSDVTKPLRKPKNLVREWDMGKDSSEVPSNDVNKAIKEEGPWGLKTKEKHGDKVEGMKRRPPSPIDNKAELARKVKKRDIDAPAKLLDDLFKKTDASPCIYWLPLTASQIAVKEEMRRQHMAEHQKRLAEMRKSETLRRDKDKSRDRERERGKDRRRK